MILDKIVEATKIRVQEAKNNISPAQIKKMAVPSTQPFAFEKALASNEIAFICEVKKGSPSKGIIAQNFPYVQIAEEYQAAGASAISVLTEPQFFLGKNKYLTEIKKAVTIPLLRKDFIIEEYQIYESAVIGADAILLICALLETNRLREYIRIARSLGLSCLVEAHNRAEVESATDAGAQIIGVNNRDLRTFEVDIQTSMHLRQFVPEGTLFVSESGIKTPKDVRALRDIGTNAVLIGETLMRSADKKQTIEHLRGH